MAGADGGIIQIHIAMVGNVGERDGLYGKSLSGREQAFGLKGGTAINLFVRDLPSVSQSAQKRAASILTAMRTIECPTIGFQAKNRKYRRPRISGALFEGLHSTLIMDLTIARISPRS